MDTWTSWTREGKKDGDEGDIVKIDFEANICHNDYSITRCPRCPRCHRCHRCL